MQWIDTHAHLNNEDFAATVGEVVARAAAAGVESILVIGIDSPSSVRAIQLAQQYPSLYAVVGLQPNGLASLPPESWDEIREMSTAQKVVAIGETGMDRYWDSTPIPMQRDYFLRHLHLAHELSLPVVIHCREAEADILEVFDEFTNAVGGPIQGVMHSFSGSKETALRSIELGLHVSIAGMVTYKKNDALREMAAAIPLDRLLVETDSPYLAPVPHRGKTNEPAFVVHTGACLATVHGVSAEEIAQTTTANARRLFRLP